MPLNETDKVGLFLPPREQKQGHISGRADIHNQIPCTSKSAAPASSRHSCFTPSLRNRGTNENWTDPSKIRTYIDRNHLCLKEQKSTTQESC